ncbi:MAG: hypothetical protein J6W72_02030 [Candidatus Methanomethylophilaceae archaeon]|nr:hypothetical protein [Candidatus Methanomethylophilaceae archaeon]
MEENGLFTSEQVQQQVQKQVQQQRIDDYSKTVKTLVEKGWTLDDALDLVPEDIRKDVRAKFSQS